MNKNKFVEINYSNECIDYKKSVKFMEKRIVNIYSEVKPELIWFLNHNSIYTMGTSANINEIHKKTNIPIITSNRGGKTTYHGPGQRIVYFLINLNKRKKDIRLFIKIIEKSIIELLKIYKINANSDRNNIGIWVKNKKISAICIRVKKWIAYHGCSININNDLSYYKKIIPCGLSNKKITSFEDLGVKKIVNLNENIEKIFIKNLAKI